MVRFQSGWHSLDVCSDSTGKMFFAIGSCRQELRGTGVRCIWVASVSDHHGDCGLPVDHYFLGESQRCVFFGISGGDQSYAQYTAPIYQRSDMVVRDRIFHFTNVHIHRYFGQWFKTTGSVVVPESFSDRS